MAVTTNPIAGERVTRAETDAEREERLAEERMLLDEAREDVRQGRVVADAEVEAWLDRLVRGEDLPMPDARPASGAK